MSTAPASRTTAAETAAPGRTSDGATAAPAAQGDAVLFSAEENKTFQSIVEECNAFADYERQHQEVLMSLENDEVLDKFRTEYAGLHHSLLYSHEGEGRLLRKCNDLESDIRVCTQKAVAAAELLAGDQSTITHLRREMDRTANKLVQVREKEGQLKEAVVMLKREIATHQAKLLEPIEAPEQEAAFQSLRRLHETVQREEERLVQQLRSTSFDVASTQRRIAALLESNSAKEAELRLLHERIASKGEEALDIFAAKTQREEELRAVRGNVTRRVGYSTAQQQQLATLGDDHERNGRELCDARHEEAKLTEEYQALSRQLQHVDTALQDCNEENDVWQRRVVEKTSEMQAQQSAVVAAHRRYMKAQKVIEALQRRNAVVEQQRVEQQERQREATAQLRQSEVALARAQQEAQAVEQTLASVKKEVNVLRQSVAGEAAQQQRNATWLAEKRGQQHVLESLLTASEEQNQQTRQELYVVTQDAETHEADVKQSAVACARLLGEMESTHAALAQQEAQLADTASKIKQQQSLLEAVTAERNTYTSHYDQLKHGLGEQQHSFGLLLTRIQTAKSAAQKREKEVKVEEAHIQLLQQQQRELELHLSNYHRRAGNKHRMTDTLVQELRQLRSVLGDAAEEIARQQRRCRDVTHERDVLDRQATDRAGELNMLYERAQTQQGLLQRYDDLYGDQAQELEHLEYQTAQLAQQLAQMRVLVFRLPELQVLLNNSTRELQRERVKVQALLEEAERPVNVHPYRELAAAEPETYALVQRVQRLQRLLAQRRHELEQKEASIQSVEQRFMKAKASVARQPGPEIAEQLSAYQQNLVKKQQQMRQMQETLGFFRAQTDQFTARHDLLRERLTEMGDAYAAQQQEAERQARASPTTAANMRDERAKGGDGAGDAGATELPVYRGFVAPVGASSATPPV